MPDGRQFTVGLNFTADTSKARAELEKLKTDLNKAISTSKIGEGTDLKFDKAIQQAAKLRGVLDGATDSLGRFDLTKFTRELDKSGLKMKDVYTSLKQIGAEDAFNQLANQIQNSNAKVQILQGTFKKFFDGLKNTAMWTIQSNAIHAVQSALSGAFNYAQKLNKGLTDIAIVSDLNTQQLTEFAKTANQMAKDLSASTNDVVSGALIYYQAGLSDEEVIKRTETTIKLAQTSGESAEQISSYMTAIWNNFYDGSKSVEYYADVISYLGAVTAASNADIAEGMQSFSAVAQTVGLDFEDAAAAMTLLRDVTQQSASTIGNSLKTIFARLSSLKMGETLEDGVDLTKYTKALESVGVDVLDANGKLRDMSDILRSLAENWGNLDRAQKDALAQTVGGVRQYNNLITLMDNFDKFEELVAGSQTSDGYLQNQADEYAESWEAALNRLEAAWQGIYDQIIDDKFFIQLTNFGTFIVNTIGDIIDGMGGLKGVLSFVVMAITSIDPEKTALGIERVVEQLRNLKDALSGQATKNNIDMQNLAASFQQGMFNTENPQIFAMVEKLNEAIAKRNEIINDPVAKGSLDALIQRLGAQVEAALELDDVLENIKNKYEDFPKAKDLAEKAQKQSAAVDALSNTSTKKERGAVLSQLKADPAKFGFDADFFKDLQIKGGKVGEKIAKEWKEKISAALATTVMEMNQAIGEKDTENAIKKIFGDEANVQKIQGEVKKALKEIKVDQEKNAEEAEGWEKIVKRIAEDAGISEDKFKKLFIVLANGKKTMGDLDNTPPDKTPKHWSETATSILRVGSAITSTSSAMDSLWTNLNKGNLNFTSLMSSITSIGFGIVNMGRSFDGLSAKMIKSGLGMKIFGKLSEEGLAAATGGLSILISLAISLAATIIPKLIKSWQDYQYSLTAEGKLDAANKALETQTQLVEKLNSKYEETISTLDKFKNNDYLKDVKEGTVQWTEAVQKNNEAALNLLETYGLLDKANYSINSKGVININDDVLKKIEQNAQDQLATARLGVYAAKNNQGDAAVNLKASDLNKLIEQQQKLRYTEYTRDKDAVYGTTEAMKGENAFNGNGKTIEDVLKSIDIAGSLENFLKMASPNAFGDWVDLIKGSEELQNSINNLIVATDKNTAAKEARDQQIGSNLLDEMDYNGPEYARDYVEQQLGAKYDEQYKAQYEKLDNMSNQDIASGFVDELEKLGFTYSKAEDKFFNADGTAFEGNIRQALASEIVRVSIVSNDTTDEYLAQQYAQTDEGKQEQADWEAGEAERQQKSSLEWANEEVTEAGFENDEKFASLKESVKAAADEIDRLSENVKEDEVALIQVAKAVEQSERGYAELAKNWKSWKEALETGLDEGNIEAYTEALTGTVDALADVMNISDELTEANMQLGDTFRDYVAENLDVVQKAVEGDTDAILELQEVATEDIVGQLAEKNADALGLTAERIQEIGNMVGSAWDDIRAQLESGEIRVGDNINDGPLMQKLTDIINSVAMTSQEAQLLLSQMGFEAEVEEDDKVYRKTDQYLVPAKYSQGPTLRYGLEGSFFTVQQDSPATYEPVESEEVQPVHALRIKTAKYVGGGNITTKKGGNGKGTGGNGKGKGGGGGEKKITPKSKDSSRYHEIKSQLEQTKHYLDMIEMAEGRAYGQKKLDLIDQKIELLKREAEQYGELYKEAKKYYDEDKEVLNSQYGAAFNADGSIKDYDSWYGHFVDMYNSGKMSDDEWKKFEDAIKKYEQSLKEMNDAEKKTQEDLNKVYDAKLEKVEYRLKTVTDLIKMDMEYLDYMLEMLDDDGLDTAEAIAYLSKEIDDITKKYDANKEALAGIFKNHEGVTDDIINQLYSGQLSVEDFIETIGDFTQKEIDTIQNIMSSMFENGKDLKKYIEELYKKLDELSDKFQEAIDKQIDKLDHFNKMIEKTKNIIDVMGKDTLGISDELLNRMQRSQIEIGKEHIATLQQEIDQYRVWIQELEQQYAVMNPEDLEAKNLKKIIDSYKEVYDGLKEDLLDTTADVGEEIKKYWREIIDQTVEYAGNAISGAIGDFEKMLDMYDKQKKIDDLYLDTYKKTYETNKLLRDINKSINDTDNIKGQKALRDLQKEILGYQDEGVQLTEYQIEERRKYYDLLLAEIALEEAQNAKSQVRMTRDNEGNWSYTYTADQEQVDNLQQNYDDKLFAYEDFNNKTLEGALDTYNQLTQDWLGALSEAATAEEVALINNYYTPMIQAAGQTVDYIMGRNNELTQNFDVNNNEIATSLADTAYGAVTNYETIGEAMDALDVAIGEATESIIGSLQSMDEEQLALAESVGVTEPQVEELINNARDAVDEVHVAVAGDGTDEHPGIAKDFDDEFNGALNTLSAFYTKSGPIINNIINEVGKITHKVNEVIDAYSRLNNTPIVTPDLSGPIGAFRRLEAAANAAAAAAAAAASAGAGVGGGGGNSGVETHGASKGGGGCFKAGTKITMADGSYKNIEEIQVGDNIISYDELTKEFKTDIVTNIFIHSNIKTIVKIYLSNNNILYTTPNHPLLSTKGWKSLDIIGALFIHGVFTTIMKNNDELIGINKNLKIINIEQNNNLDNIPMYNLSTKNYHTYLVDNLIAHNKIATQEMLAVDTGGLMDAWGPEGKIAMLHEKELVLNKQDTVNMLQTVEFVRDLVQMIGANASVNSLNDLFASKVSPGGNHLDQNVTIHAEFPNAVDHSEIEEAFQNLIGLAGQYAGRKQ